MAKIISTLKEKPRLKTTWWVMRLGLSSLLAPLLGIVNGVLRQVFDPVSINNNNLGVPMGFAGVMLALVLSISAVIVGIRVYNQGERTWVLWAGFIPAVLVALFWTFMLVGELLIPN